MYHNEADNSPLCNVQVKDAKRYPTTPPYVFMTDLISQRDFFLFYNAASFLGRLSP
jgi:hypothetical protein